MPGKRKLEQEITADEAKLYDRQIRLWGMEAQQRMRNTSILVIGVTAVTNEVLKNIVLAGIGRVTVMDETNVKSQDLAAQFLLRKADLGMNLLNPRVVFEVNQTSVKDEEDHFFQRFDMVCMIGKDPEDLLRINELCRLKNIKFWASDNLGVFSYIFSDLGMHKFSFETRRTGSEGEVSLKTERVESFSSLAETMQHSFGHQSKEIRKWRRVAHPLFFAINSIRTLILVIWAYWLSFKKYPTLEDEVDLMEASKEYMDRAQVDTSYISKEYLMQIVTSRNTQMPTASAIIGGFLGQEVLKVLAQTEVPLKNFFCHDAMEATGSN